MSGPVTPIVEQASAADAEQVSLSLAAAFATDPVMMWLMADEGSRRQRLAVLFSVFLRAHYLGRGEVWATGDRSAAALWAPPGHAIVPPSRIALQLPGVLRAFRGRTYRALRTFEHVERHHPRPEHWYLGVLGTRPERQGHGLGSAVLRPVLDRCDAEGLPAYLESSKESNIAFYRRHGFELRGELQLPYGGPPVWPMWRDPRPPAG